MFTGFAAFLSRGKSSQFLTSQSV